MAGHVDTCCASRLMDFDLLVMNDWVEKQILSVDHAENASDRLE